MCGVGLTYPCRRNHPAKAGMWTASDVSYTGVSYRTVALRCVTCLELCCWSSAGARWLFLARAEFLCLRGALSLLHTKCRTCGIAARALSLLEPVVFTCSVNLKGLLIKLRPLWDGSCPSLAVRLRCRLSAILLTALASSRTSVDSCQSNAKTAVLACRKDMRAPAPDAGGH